MRWLAYVHPAVMLGVLALGLLVLRDGVRVRTARLRGGRPDARRHRRLARWFVALVLLGFGSGLGSAVGLRGMEALESVHAWLAGSACTGLATAAGLGLWLEARAPGRVRTLHAACGAAGLLVALAGAVAGFAILP